MKIFKDDYPFSIGTQVKRKYRPYRGTFTILDYTICDGSSWCKLYKSDLCRTHGKRILVNNEQRDFVGNIHVEKYSVCSTIHSGKHSLAFTKI